MFDYYEIFMETEPMFKPVLEKVSSQFKEAEEERKELGLSYPEDCDVNLALFGNYGETAWAEMSEKGPKIRICMVPAILPYLTKNEKEDAAGLSAYFHVAREIYCDIPDGIITLMMANPEKMMDNIEINYIGKTLFKKYKDSLSKNGRSYEDYREGLIKNSEGALRAMKALKPRIAEIFSKVGTPSLRHEIDHTDLFDSVMLRRYSEQCGRVAKLENAFHFDDKTALSGEYAREKMRLLKMKSEVIPILETRALFFSKSETGKLKNGDFDLLKREVSDHFAISYAGHFCPEDMADAIVADYWSRGMMDKQTSNYIFESTSISAETSSRGRYLVEYENVDYDIANRVLRVEIPFWERKFARNAKKAANAIALAFKNNPKRLNEAKKARTLDEFITVCEGK